MLYRLRKRLKHVSNDHDTAEFFKKNPNAVLEIDLQHVEVDENFPKGMGDVWFHMEDRQSREADDFSGVISFKIGVIKIDRLEPLPECKEIWNAL